MWRRMHSIPGHYHTLLLVLVQYCMMLHTEYTIGKSTGMIINTGALRGAIAYRTVRRYWYTGIATMMLQKKINRLPIRSVYKQDSLKIKCNITDELFTFKLILKLDWCSGTPNMKDAVFFAVPFQYLTNDDFRTLYVEYLQADLSYPLLPPLCSKSFRSHQIRSSTLSCSILSCARPNPLQKLQLPCCLLPGQWATPPLSLHLVPPVQQAQWDLSQLAGS